MKIKLYSRTALTCLACSFLLLSCSEEKLDPGKGTTLIEDKKPESKTSDFSPSDIKGIKDDIKLKVTGGSASSTQSGAVFSKTYNGKIDGNIWHSNWDNSGENYFPITCEWEFDNEDINYLIYYPRLEGHNGNFKKVRIEAKLADKTTYDVVFEEYDFQGSSTPTRVDFPKQLKGVKAIKFIIMSGTGDRKGFAACSEMEFYKKNPEAFNPLDLFTDTSCSEIKPGVTLETINNCKHSFFKKLAEKIYSKKYNKEFRVANFKAYAHPDEQSRINKTASYSLLDNPTGIAVKPGEELIVCTGPLPRTKISLRIQDYNTPNADGFYTPSVYALSEGINKIKMNKRGLVYVLYHSPNYENLPEVKLHFATGNASGYIDSQNKAHEGREREILNAATHKYIDVLGKYAHLTFPVEKFKQNTTNIRELINDYDSIAFREQEFLGLVKYDRMHKNRMYLHVMYKAYMYSTNYHTAYNNTTLATLTDNRTFRDHCWGVAHEIGHANQTRPGLKWHGTTEVTTNIFSEYIQTTIFRKDSRLQKEDKYKDAWNHYIVKKNPHAGGSPGPFNMLVPFWQLELFFGKVLGRTPLQQEDKGGFYADVFEYIRVNDNKPNAGEQQLEFAYICSKISGYDLTDFFLKWGFLRPINLPDLDDYGKRPLVVGENQIIDVTNRIKALNLPKIEMPLEYITDLNYEVFKKKADIVQGQCRLEKTSKGTILTMDNWENVVVYEIRSTSEEGKLIHVNEGKTRASKQAKFTVPGKWEPHYRVYAVSYDNKRILVNPKVTPIS